MSTCKERKFYKPTAYGGGHCRLYPPVAFHSAAGWANERPYVADDDWCG